MAHRFVTTPCEGGLTSGSGLLQTHPSLVRGALVSQTNPITDSSSHRYQVRGIEIMWVVKVTLNGHDRYVRAERDVITLYPSREGAELKLWPAAENTLRAVMVDPAFTEVGRVYELKTETIIKEVLFEVAALPPWS